MNQKEDLEEQKRRIVKKALSKLDSKERETIIELINVALCDERIEFLREFVINFDKSSPLDTCICQVMTQVGQCLGMEIIQDTEEKIKQGKMRYNGKRLLELSVNTLEAVATRMRQSMAQFSAEASEAPQEPQTH